jgi:hypothetical protein
MSLASNRPGIFLGIKGGRRVGLTTHRYLYVDCLETVGASTSHNPMGLHGLLQGELYLYLYVYMAVYENHK